MEHWWSDDWHERIEVLGEKAYPVSLCPQQISHVLPWDLTWASTVMYGTTTKFTNSMEQGPS
jgi:hypothetical protein